MRTHFLLIPATSLLFAVGLVAQAPKPAPGPAPAAAARPRAAAPQGTSKPVATVKDVMDFIVIPSSEFVFNAVSSTQGPNGAEDKAPKTDADWAEVRKYAVLL